MIKRIFLPVLILFSFVILAIGAHWLAPFDPHFVDVSQKLQAPNSIHLLGTDQLGRDCLSRLLYGARYSLMLSLIITSLEVGIGLLVGLWVGWFQGWIERTFLWFANILSAFPSFLLALATIGILGQGMGNLIVSIVIVEWIFYAKMVSNLVKSAKQEIYVLAAKNMGLPTLYILHKHILPFVYRPLMVMALMNVGNIILMISGFSFLGLGVQPNVAEWGMMLHDARPYFNTAIWMMLSPGLSIFLTVFSFNILGKTLDSH